MTLYLSFPPALPSPSFSICPTRPRCRLVENSWGDGSGTGAGAGDPYGLKCNKGFYLMSNEWFDEYMYQIIVKKSDLDAELTATLDQAPTILPAWDPMGALAVCSSPDAVAAAL